MDILGGGCRLNSILFGRGKDILEAIKNKHLPMGVVWVKAQSKHFYVGGLGVSIKHSSMGWVWIFWRVQTKHNSSW